MVFYSTFLLIWMVVCLFDSRGASNSHFNLQTELRIGRKERRDYLVDAGRGRKWNQYNIIARHYNNTSIFSLVNLGVVYHPCHFVTLLVRKIIHFLFVSYHYSVILDIVICHY
jgi:hypothetical protein